MLIPSLLKLGITFTIKESNLKGIDLVSDNGKATFAFPFLNKSLWMHSEMRSGKIRFRANWKSIGSISFYFFLISVYKNVFSSGCITFFFKFRHKKFWNSSGYPFKYLYKWNVEFCLLIYNLQKWFLNATMKDNNGIIYSEFFQSNNYTKKRLLFEPNKHR